MQILRGPVLNLGTILVFVVARKQLQTFFMIFVGFKIAQLQEF